MTMKTLLLVSLLGLASRPFVFAQNFSGKTNNVFLNFKAPVTSEVAVSVPLIQWKSPQLEYTNSTANSTTIEATVYSAVDIKSIRVIIGDGSTQRGEKPIEVGAVKEFTIVQPINLQGGLNVIEIVAENVDGGRTSDSRSVLVGNDATSNSVAIDRKDYALLFATDQYDNWPDLVNPVDDARSIAKVLKEKYGFEIEIVENPNLDDVFNKLAEYGHKKFKPQDQLMIFFAGHGYFDENFGEGFVVAKNSLQNDNAKTTYISHNRLRGVVSNIPSEHIFLAMDVCFGGTFDPVVARTRGVEPEEASDTEFLARKLSRRTRKYLTSGGKEYVSDGIPGKHSPFTLKLLQALTDGGGADHILTLAELKAYIEKLKSEPRLGSFGDDTPDSDFVFVSQH
jgi:hypothetical protein